MSSVYTVGEGPPPEWDLPDPDDGGPRYFDVTPVKPCKYPHHPRWEGSGGRLVCGLCHPPAQDAADRRSGDPKLAPDVRVTEPSPAHLEDEVVRVAAGPADETAAPLRLF